MRFSRAAWVAAASLLVIVPLTLPASASNAAVHPIRPTASTQVLVVSASSMSTTRATLTAYSWDGSTWQRAFAPMQAYLGANGLTDHPSESDYYTPIGQYNITTVFGSEPDPGTLFPYRQATPNDHWVDDPSSPYYNTWQTGPSAGRWQSAETLSNYRLAAAFDFNQDPVIAGGDSAIFLHSGTSATLGCVTVTSTDLTTLLTWIDPADAPQIVIGVAATPPVHIDTVTTPMPWAQFNAGQPRAVDPARSIAYTRG